MFKKMLKNRILIASAAISAILCFLLCGCGIELQSTEQPNTSSRAPAPSSSSAPSSSAAHDANGQGSSGSGSSSSGSAQSESTSIAPDYDDYEEPDPRSIEAIAEIADWKANVERIGNGRYCIVFVDDDEHNPYDVIWDYGWQYDDFVELVDEDGMWDVLFDAGFYKSHYPMLALQYHDDNALLLEHFQTVGVHEGRQASEAFNVVAYMENCDRELVDAFGDHYECYYFYWALNHDSESKVNTKSNGHPLQMCVKLTDLQAYELKKVNEYRTEVGAKPVIADPELMAFACYRATCDYTGTYTGHAWLDTHMDYAQEMLAVWHAGNLAENTTHGSVTSEYPQIVDFAKGYRNSPEHYAAMVDGLYGYFGCSNLYWGPDGHGGDGYKDCQYDLYLDGPATSYQIGTR